MNENKTIKTFGEPEENYYYVSYSGGCVVPAESVEAARKTVLEELSEIGINPDEVNVYLLDECGNIK